MADGAYYNDYLEPHLTIDGIASPITLASTYKALLTQSQLPVLGTNRFGKPGKKFRIRITGKLSTFVTPGNFQIALFYGTGADANGVKICESLASALTASQSNMSWMAEFYVHCRTVGSAGTLFGTGIAHLNPLVLASTLQPLMIPSTAPAASAACDLTSPTLILSPQMLRSGSTAEVASVHDFEMISLN